MSAGGLDSAAAKASAEFAELKAVVDAHARARPVPANPALSEDPAWEAMDEAFFKVRLHAARVASALDAVEKGVALARDEADRSRQKLDAASDKLRAFEERERLGPILGASYLAESWRATNPEPLSGRTTTAAGSVKDAAMPHRCAEGTAPCGCGQAAHHDGSCVHRTVLATGIIDKTFEEHRRWLRQRVAELEAELGKWRSGEAAEEARRTNDALRQALVDKNNELDEVRRRSVAAVAAASRRAAVTTSEDSSSRSSVSALSHSTAEPAQRRFEQLQRNALLDKAEVHRTMCDDVLQAAMSIKLGMFLDSVALPTRQEKETTEAVVVTRRPSPPNDAPPPDVAVRSFVDAKAVRPMGSANLTPRSADAGACRRLVAAIDDCDTRDDAVVNSRTPLREARTTLPMVPAAWVRHDGAPKPAVADVAMLQPPIGGSGVSRKPIHVRSVAAAGMTKR